MTAAASQMALYSIPESHHGWGLERSSGNRLNQVHLEHAAQSGAQVSVSSVTCAYQCAKSLPVCPVHRGTSMPATSLESMIKACTDTSIIES